MVANFLTTYLLKGLKILTLLGRDSSTCFCHALTSLHEILKVSLNQPLEIQTQICVKCPSIFRYEGGPTTYPTSTSTGQDISTVEVCNINSVLPKKGRCNPHKKLFGLVLNSRIMAILTILHVSIKTRAVEITGK